MKSFVFASRNFKELIREPLSWVFCMGFPIVMLVLMTVINESIPPQAGMTLFQLQNLAPGIGIFGLTFIMLFASLLVSGDRKDAFLLRIFTSPMKSWEYISGYILPLIILGIGQLLVSCIASLIMGAVLGTSLDMVNMLVSVVAVLPAIIMFISFGLLFGTLFTKNAAPGICSIIICLSGMLGGIWMDVESIGGVLKDICGALPFYHAVNAVREVFGGDFSAGFAESGIVLIWAAVVTLLAIIVFRKKMRF